MKVVKVYSMKQAFKDLKRCPRCHLMPSIQVCGSHRDLPFYRISCGINHRLANISISDYSLKAAVCDYNEAVDTALKDKYYG